MAFSPPAAGRKPIKSYLLRRKNVLISVSLEQALPRQNGSGQAQKNFCAEVSTVGIFEDNDIMVDISAFSFAKIGTEGRENVGFSEKKFLSRNVASRSIAAEQQSS